MNRFPGALVLSLSLSLSVAPLVASILFFALPAQAALYAPGETLDPACAPTDVDCGITSVVGTGTTGQVPYYAANGGVLAATSSLTILSNGNIGIGTTTPYAKLSVVGPVVAEYFHATSSTATSTFGGGLSVAGSAGLTVFTNGKMGVGTTSPWGQFSINPNGITGPAFVVGSSTATNFIVSNSGNVGVGTTSPYAPFSVAGNVVITGTISSPGTGANSEKFGFSSQATGSNGVALGPFSLANFSNGVGIGYDSRPTASFGIAIGNTARAANAATALGYAVTAAGANSVAIGNSATTTASGAVVIGQNASVYITETQSVAIGQNASTTRTATGGGESVAVGGNAFAGEWRATALGWKAKATAISSTAIGRGALSEYTHAIAVGRGAWTNAANQIAIGFSGGDVATDVYFESGHTSKYVDWPDGTTITRTPSLTPIVIHGFDGFDATAAPTNNIAGGDLKLAAGRSTGTANGGSVIIQTAPAGGVSNNTKNSLVDRLTIAQGGNVGVASSSPWRTFSVVGTVAFNGLTSSATGNAVCITTTKDITDAGGASCVPSSIRFKENVKTLQQDFALTELNKLRVVSFDYKPGFYSPEDAPGSYGLIAEEVEDIDPLLVDYGYDGKPLTLRFDKLLGLAIQAIQNLSEKIDGFAQSITTGVVNANKICLDGVCITKNELQNLLEESNQSSAPTPPTPEEPTPPPADEESNDEVITEDPVLGQPAEETPPTEAPSEPETESPPVSE